MIIQRLFVGLLSTVFVTTSMVQAATETRLQGRKRLDCEQNMTDQDVAQGGDVKRHSPDMPALGALSLAQEGPAVFVAADEPKRMRIDIIELFKSGSGLAGVTLESSDLENIVLPADALNCAPENRTSENKNVGTPESFIQGVIRWLVHDALQSKDKVDANVYNNVALLSDKCDIIAVRDLMVEASMADNCEVADLLIQRARVLEKNELSSSTYQAMAKGFCAALYPKKMAKKVAEFYKNYPKESADLVKNELVQPEENSTAKYFRSMTQDKIQSEKNENYDENFVKAVEDFK
jgi:hypothetical protein